MKLGLFICFLSGAVLAGGDGGMYLEGHYTGKAYDGLSSETEDCTVSFDVRYLEIAKERFGFEFSARTYVCPKATYEIPGFVAETKTSKWAFWETLFLKDEAKGISTSRSLSLEQLSETHAYFSIELTAEYVSLVEGIQSLDGQHAFYARLDEPAKQTK